MRLPNDCSCSNPSVSPKNWKSVTASTKKDWYIQYYFKDPTQEEKYPHGKLVIVKGMNRYKSISERRMFTRAIMEEEVENLLSGYNPIKGYLDPEIEGLSHRTPFSEAIGIEIKCAATTKMDLKSTVKFITKAAKSLNKDWLPVGKVSRGDLKKILELATEKKSDNTYNAYRKNLAIIYRELVECEAVEYNFLRDIRKRKIIRKIKRILTPEECKKINDWVRVYDYQFYLLINIFFHSGCRTTEIFRVQGKHVDLINQTVLITVLKGNQPFEVLKPIKDIAVEFWKQATKDAAPDDFIFSHGLLPGKEQINPRQASRRWKRHIKGKLGITCDWYGLKYLNSDQIAESQGIEMAALINSHQNINTTKLYAVGENKRGMDRIRKIGNKFG